MELVSKTMVQKSPALQIPMGFIYAMFPAAAVIMILNNISYTIRYMTGRTTDPDMAKGKGE
jgi:TRAP-type C4-dicarboxylate transport system permease small subunit